MLEPETKTFLDHLEDLRGTIIRIIGTIFLGVVFSCIFTPQLLAILKWPLVNAGQDPKQLLGSLGVTDAISMQMEIGLSGGIILALPVVLYVVGQYLLPALTIQEKRMVIPVFAMGAFLFAAGVAFAYFLVIPQTITYLIKFNSYMEMKTQWTIQSYIDFVVQLLIGFGIAFETPLVIISLNYFGIIRSWMLSRYRRHAAVVILVAACCISPAAEPFSVGMVAVPMYLMYEACVWITLWIERR